MEIELIRDDLEEEEREKIDVEADITVAEFLDQQEIPGEEVLVARNGTIISGRHQLESGDEIKVMDVIAGG